MTGPALRIRAFADDDALRLHDVFDSSIRTHAVREHSSDQVSAWSPALDASLTARWIERMRRIGPFIVEVVGSDGLEIAAYADLQPDGYIDHFFVAGRFGHRGVGTRLMKHLIDTARERGIGVLTSDVSMTAQPFFGRFGFVIVERRRVVLRGVEFSSARMRLDLEVGADLSMR